MDLIFFLFVCLFGVQQDAYTRGRLGVLTEQVCSPKQFWQVSSLS